eukprot:9166310-Lingulodinium_polyedra.AAC.1
MLTARCARIATKFQTTRGGVANIASAGRGRSSPWQPRAKLSFVGGGISDRACSVMGSACARALNR